MQKPVVRGAVAVLLLAVGFLAGVAGAFTHAILYRPGGVPLPVGVVLTLLGCIAIYTFGGVLLRAPLGAALPALGWLVPTVVFLVYTPHEDSVIALTSDVHGIISLVYVFGGVLAAAGAAYTPWRLLAARWDEQAEGGGVDRGDGGGARPAAKRTAAASPSPRGGRKAGQRNEPGTGGGSKQASPGRRDARAKPGARAGQGTPDTGGARHAGRPGGTAKPRQRP